MKINKIRSLIYFAALLAVLPSCNKEKKSSGGEDAEVIPDDIVEMREDQIKLAGIEFGAVEMRSLSGTISAGGVVLAAPQNMATVSAPLGGFVRSSFLLPGNAVAKGQTLAIIENQDFIDIQQNYLDACNKLEFAEAEYKRHTELYKDDVYSQKSLQQVTSEYRSMKTQVKALEQKLMLIGINPAKLHEDNITRSVAIVSPITGFLKTVNVNVGKYVTPADVMFEIVNNDKLFLELTLFEKDVDRVSAGNNIRFFLNNETEQHNATVYQVGKAVNADKSFRVYASVNDKCKNMISGMYVNAVIEASSSRVESLPSEAVVSFDDKDYIFVFDKNKQENGKPFTEYRMVEVHKGVSEGGYTEIIFPEGFDTRAAKVVVKGAYNLLSAKKNAGEMAC